MDTPPPPDPYAALGVSKSADASTIKKAYHKLALKFHPDKCTDQSQTAARTEEFTKVQQAYDLIGDEEKRGRYDASIKLAELRAQMMRDHAAPRADVRATSYNTRTAAPKDTSYSTRGSTRTSYEQAKTRYQYEDDYEAARGSTRKTSGQDEYANAKKAASSERQREKIRVTVDPRDEERRREVKRREAEVRDSRSAKYSKEDFEEARRQRDAAYEHMRRQTEEARPSSTERRTSEKINAAQRHMEARSVPTRPTMSRRESSRRVPTYEETRRAAPAPKEKERVRETRRTPPAEDDRYRSQENIEPSRRTAPLKSQMSSPPVMDHPPPQPHRSYTQPEVQHEARKKKSREQSPPTLLRSTTQPVETMGASSSSRRKDTATRSRHAEPDSGYSSSAPTPGLKHSYTTDGQSPPVSMANHRTVLREPSSSRSPTRSGPSTTAAKMAGLDPKKVKVKQYSYPSGERPGERPTVIVEPASKSSSRRERVSEPERYSSQPKYFGEQGAGTTDPRYHQSSRYADEGVSFAPRYTRDDIKYAPSSTRRGRDTERAFPPPMQRHQTYVY